jgi:predicted trehalose synthase
MPDTTRTQPALAAVDLPDLADWLPRQRWFGGKGRAIAGVRPVDVLRLPDGPGGPVWLTPVAVAHADGGAAERWLLVLAAAEDADADDDVLGRVEDVPVVELSARPAAARALLSAVAAGGRLASARGEHATARTWGPGLSAVLGPRTRVRAVGVEQSNTSLVVGDPHADAAVVVKVIRRLEAGPNPDVEVTAALTESGFRGVPALLGALTGPADEALISASAFVAEARDASDLAAAEAGGRADHGVGEGMADLGRLTADLHARLREVLPTAPAGADDVAAWARA